MSMELDAPQEEVVDEYLQAFEALESEAPSEASIARCNELLLSDRTDEVAVKIKEKCIYKLAKHHSGNVFTILSHKDRSHA